MIRLILTLEMKATKLPRCPQSPGSLSEAIAIENGGLLRIRSHHRNMGKVANTLRRAAAHYFRCPRPLIVILDSVVIYMS